MIRLDRNFALDESRTAFDDATDWNLRVVGAIGDDQWGRPGLGEWDVLELVAHTSRAYLTVENYVQSTGDIDVASAAAYFHQAFAGGDPEGRAAANAAIAERGRKEAELLRADPVRINAERAAAARHTVGHAAVGSVAVTPMGTLSLADYLATRVVELTVHTIDIADAIGLDDEPPPVATGLTITVLTALAVTPSPSVLIRALAGRVCLPEGFSVFG